MQIRTTKTGRSIKLYKREIDALLAACRLCEEIHEFTRDHAADDAATCLRSLASVYGPKKDLPLFDKKIENELDQQSREEAAV